MSTMLGIKKEFSKNFEEESETYLQSLEQFPKIQLEKTAVNKGINTPLVDEIKRNNLKDWTTYTYQKYFTFQSRQYLNRTNSEIAKHAVKQSINELESLLKDILLNDKDNDSLNVNISSSELDLSKIIGDINKVVSDWMLQPVLKSTFEDLDIIEVDQVYRDFLLSSDKSIITNLLQLLEKIENEKATLKINNQDFGLLKPSLISEGVEELKSMSDLYNKNQYNYIIREINSLNSLIEKIKDSFDKTLKNEGERIWSFSNEVLSFWEDIKKKNGEGEINKRKIVNLFKDDNSHLIPKFTDYWNDNVASHIKKGKKKKNADNFMKGKTDEEILEYMDKTFEDFFNNMTLYNKKWRDEVVLKIIDQQRDLIKEIETKLVSSLTLEKERISKSSEDKNEDTEKEQNEILQRCQVQLEKNAKIQENWEKLVQELIKTCDEQQKLLEEQYNELITEYKKSINLTGRLEKVNKKDFMKQIKAVESQANSNRSRDLMHELYTIHELDEPILETLICLLQEGELNEKQFVKSRYASIKENQKYKELVEKRKDILTRCQNEIMAGFIYMGVKIDSMFIEESCRMSETSLTFQKLGISVSSSKKNKKKKNKKKKSASASASTSAANSEDDLTETTVDTPEPGTPVVENTVVLDSKPPKKTTPINPVPMQSKAERTESLIKQSIEASEKIIKKEAENAEKKPSKMLFTDIVNKPAPPPVEKKVTKKPTTPTTPTSTTTSNVPKNVKSVTHTATSANATTTTTSTTTTTTKSKKTILPSKPVEVKQTTVKSQSQPSPQKQQQQQQQQSKIQTEDTVVEPTKTEVKKKEEKKEPKSELKKDENENENEKKLDQSSQDSKENQKEQKINEPESKENQEEQPQVEEQEQKQEQEQEKSKEQQSSESETKENKEEENSSSPISKNEFINENVFTNGASQKEPSEEFNLFKPHDDLLNSKTTGLPMSMNNMPFVNASNSSATATTTSIPMASSSFSPFSGSNNNSNFNIAAALLNGGSNSSSNSNLAAVNSFLNMGSTMPIDPSLAFLLAANDTTTVTPPFIDMGQSKEQLAMLINHLQNENQQLKLTLNKLIQQTQQFTNQKCQEVSNMAVEFNHLKLQFIEKSHQCSTLEDELNIQKMINQEKSHTIETLKKKLDSLLHHHGSSGLGGRTVSDGGNSSNSSNVYRPPKMRNNSYHHYNNNNNNNSNGEKSGGSFSSGRSSSYNSKFGGFSKSNSSGGNNNNNGNNSNSSNKPPGFEYNGWRKQVSKSSSHGHGHGHHSTVGHSLQKKNEDHSIPTSNIFASLNDDEHDSDSLSSEVQETEVEAKVVVEKEEKQENEEKQEKNDNKEDKVEAMVQEPASEPGSEPTSALKQEAVNQNINEVEKEKEKETQDIVTEPKEEEGKGGEGSTIAAAATTTTNESTTTTTTTTADTAEAAATAVPPSVPIIPEPDAMPEIEATTTSAAELLG